MATSKKKPKKERMESHIEDYYLEHGRSKEEAERIAKETVEEFYAKKRKKHS